jgi:hypothetical protein
MVAEFDLALIHAAQVRGYSVSELFGQEMEAVIEGYQHA